MGEGGRGGEVHPSLPANFSWTFLGNLAYAASQWGMLVVIARFGSPEQVGRFTLGFALSAPLLLFSTLALRQFQATDARGEYAFREYLAVRLVTTALALLALAILTRAGGYRPESALVILLIGLAKSVEAVSDICYGLFQKQERMDCIAVSLLAKAVLSLAFLGFGFLATRSLAWGSLGLALAWLLVLLAFDRRNVSRILKRMDQSGSGPGELKPGWDLPRYFRLAARSLPLSLAAVLVTLNSNIPRYLVEHYLGEKSLGVFAAMLYSLYAGNTVVGALGQSAVPRLAKYALSREKARFVALLARLLALGALVGLGGVLVARFLGREVLAFFYGAEYARDQAAFVWIMLAGGIGYLGSFLGYGLTAARCLRPQPLVYLIPVLLSLSLGPYLIPRYGIAGAAWLLPLVASAQLLLATLATLFTLMRLEPDYD